MATRISCIAIDSADPAALGAWWAETLGWDVVAPPDPRDFQISMPGSDAWTPSLLFLPSVETKIAKNRIHFDVASGDFDTRDKFVEVLLARGAMLCDIGQADVSWTVMADPEGNEFCVLEPNERHQSGHRLASIVIDSLDMEGHAEFWEHASAWKICDRSDDLIGLRSPSNCLPDIEFVADQNPKVTKLRIHIDVEPLDGATVDAEADRLRSLGASDIDIGQHDDPDTNWIVLLDPFGHEFCVVPAE